MMGKRKYTQEEGKRILAGLIDVRRHERRKTSHAEWQYMTAPRVVYEHEILARLDEIIERLDDEEPGSPIYAGQRPSPIPKPPRSGGAIAL